MIKKSTLQLLRFHFSFFLLPVYFFALSQLPHINYNRAFLIFVLLHVLVYPSSNGYNSYMDRDETPIGGLEHPLQPTKQLFNLTLLMDFIALSTAIFVSVYFFLGLLLYIIASRAYSYRGIRLKKFPIVGFLTVMIFQGGVTFWLVYHGCSESLSTSVPLSGMLSASFLIGGFYPLTQIYQHEADKADGVQTISYLLGYKGTFVFCAVVYSMAMVFLGYTFFSALMFTHFFLLSIFFLPVLLYFFWWASRVWKDVKSADFKHTMQMNVIASLCTNLGFLTVLILNHFE
ncbi:MAG: UbiA family prenyltransferase [Bacteroidota bacterium]|jgi:1,4-dihydroxy-2-naphthoate polyprenyltransferase